MMANGMRFSFGCVVEYAVVVARRTSFAICDWSTASCDCFNIASAVLTSCLLCVFSFLYFCSAPGISTFFFGLDDVKWRRGRKTIQQSRCQFFYIDEVHSTKNKKQKHKQGEEYRLCHSSVVCRTGSLSDQKKTPRRKEWHVDTHCRTACYCCWCCVSVFVMRKQHKNIRFQTEQLNWKFLVDTNLFGTTWNISNISLTLSYLCPSLGLFAIASFAYECVCVCMHIYFVFHRRRRRF